MQLRNIRIISTILATIVVLVATPAMTAGQIKFVTEITNASSETITCVARLNDVSDVVWRKTLKPGESTYRSAGFTPYRGQSYGEFALEIDKANGSPQLICGFTAGLKGTPGNYKIIGVETEHCMFRSGNYTYSHEEGDVFIKYTFKGLD